MPLEILEGRSSILSPDHCHCSLLQEIVELADVFVSQAAINQAALNEASKCVLTCSKMRFILVHEALPLRLCPFAFLAQTAHDVLRHLEITLNETALAEEAGGFNSDLEIIWSSL